MKILVAQHWGLGNAVMTTPMLQALHTLPKTEIHCSYDETRRVVGAFLADIPCVTKVHKSSDIDGIRKEIFDVVICCGNLGNLKSKYMIPRMIQTMPDIPKGITKEESWKVYTKHEIEYLMDAARILGYVGPSKSPIVGKTSSVRLHAPTVCFGIGYFKRDAWCKRKHWGNMNYSKLGRDLAKLGIDVFVVGDSSDIADAEEIAKQSGYSIRGLSIMRTSNHRITFGLIKASHCFAGNDTGLAHVAAASGIPTLTIFQDNISSPMKNAPAGPKASYIVESNKGEKYAEVLSFICKSLKEGTANRNE